jgi:hypothetical protein
MNYQSAIDLAESTLSELIASRKRGVSTPDSSTTLKKLVYSGPSGQGVEVSVILKGRVNDVFIIRHHGPETRRNVSDKPFEVLKSEALASPKISKLPKTKAAVKAATTVDDLLFNQQDFLSDTCPVSLANWRVKAVLDMQGLTATVDAAIAALPEGAEKIVISRAWNGNGDVLRNSPTVASFKVSLGLTDSQLDEMFHAGASFNP